MVTPSSATYKNCKNNPCLEGKPVTLGNFVEKVFVQRDDYDFIPCGIGELSRKDNNGFYIKKDYGMIEKILYKLNYGPVSYACYAGCG